MDHRKIFKSAWTRVSLGLAAIGSVIVAAPSWEGDFSAEKATGVTLALLLWIGSEIFEAIDNKAPNPNDIILLRKFLEVYDENHLAFLREHDFGAAFGINKAAPIWSFSNEWQGARYTFNDPRLSSLLLKCKTAAHEFTEFSTRNTFPISQGFQSANVIDGGRHTAEGQAVLDQRFSKLNQLSTKLYESAEALIALAMKLGYVTHP